MSGLEINIMGAKIFDILTRVTDIMRDKKVSRVFPEFLDSVDKIGWRDMGADTLKAFFRLWKS